ncbi:MAG TPA: PKD domain-containing protein, partial [Anaerolineae bacterium]|nr:PKD domain-containing protein [Anaerolineae bacterium]
MLRKRREFWGLFVPFLALLALALFNSLATAFSPVDAVDNEDTIAGLVDVSMIINPAITTAGEEVVLEIRATNRGTVVANIVIDSAVPNSVTYDTRHIPASTTFNFQTNAFSWQPSIPAGETRTFTLPLRAAVADIANPFSTIEATYRYGLISDQLSAEFWVGVLPTAEILGNTDISVGQPLQLFADISGPGPFSQHWDLGDGRNFRADDPTLSYARAGNYDVVLEVSNPLGSVKTTRTITIKPDPVALFSLDDPTPAIDQEITFLNQSGGEGPLEFEWDFGDGVKAFIRQPIHQFETIGQHAVTLTVTNKFGSSTTAQPITVGEAPQMELILPSDAVMGEPLLGLVRSDDDSAEFSWDMGDGHIVDGNKLRYT